jgi:hypothetical protein
LCTHHRDLHHKKGVPHFLAMLNEHKHWKIYATLKALCILLSNLTKFDLLLSSSRFVLSTIEMTHLHSSIEDASHWKGKANEQKSICQKWKGWNGKVHIRIKSTFSMNNRLFKVNWGFRFRAKGNLTWMETFLMKTLDERSWMNNQPEYILVLHTKIQVGY